MADKPLSDITSWTDDNVMKIFSGKLTPGRKEEIILFSYNRTFVSLALLGCRHLGGKE
jgi:hypothetical protein